MSQNSKRHEKELLFAPHQGFLDILLFKLDRFFQKRNSLLITAIVSFFLGVLGNQLANSNLRTPLDLLISMFSVSRSLNWIMWLIIIVVPFLFIAPFIVRAIRKNRRYESAISAILKHLIHPSLNKYNAIGADTAITLEMSPMPDRGWSLFDNEIDLRHDTTLFAFPPEEQATYLAYKEENFYKKKFMDDKHLLMLTHNPRTFTDTPTLVLETKEILFSQVLFFREIMLRRKSTLLDNFVSDAIYGKEIIAFPNAVSMHMIVVTNDRKILITKRSEKTEWYRGTWSCSIEETSNQEDIKAGSRGTTPIMNLVQRALRQELGLSSEYYAFENIRILSVFLESDLHDGISVLNIALCTLVTLQIDCDVLSNIIRAHPREDYEFTEFDFLTDSNMVMEMIANSRPYHPTSRYRMLMFLIHLYGEADFARRFINIVIPEK